MGSIYTLYCVKQPTLASWDSQKIKRRFNTKIPSTQRKVNQWKGGGRCGQQNHNYNTGNQQEIWTTLSFKIWVGSLKNESKGINILSIFSQSHHLSNNTSSFNNVIHKIKLDILKFDGTNDQEVTRWIHNLNILLIYTKLMVKMKKSTLYWYTRK